MYARKRDNAFFAWISAKDTRRVSTLKDLLWESYALEGARLAWKAWQEATARG